MAKQTPVTQSDLAIATVPISQIHIDPSLNVRRDLSPEALEELKESIRTLGLLQPIVVMATSKKDAYKLLIGQRRFLACRALGKSKIPAIVLAEKDERTALALSLAENMERADLSHRDVARAVTELYKLYHKDARKVAGETGIPLITVRRYILVKEYASERALALLADGRVVLLDVKRALEAALYDLNKADRILEKMVDMTGEEKRRLARYASEHPSATVPEMVKEANEPRPLSRLWVDLTEPIRKGLAKASKVLHLEEQEIATRALGEWLRAQGFAQ
jgi:ParB/RepB/Spo0J family partition protein